MSDTTTDTDTKPMSDDERAEELAELIRSDCLLVYDSHNYDPSADLDEPIAIQLILAAFAAVRADEREACARRWFGRFAYLAGVHPQEHRGPYVAGHAIRNRKQDAE